jgi:hypothetical protein
MNRRTLVTAVLAAAGGGPARAAASRTQDLEALTQRLADALAPGRKDVWAALLHPKFVSTDENGAVFDRDRFLANLTPLPSGASGTLRVIDFVARDLGGLAVTTYVLDEVEQFHGETLRSQYRNTDSWVRTPQGWRLAAMQEIALRTDPPAVEIPAVEWDQYVGRYRLPDGLEFEISRQGDGAVGRQAGGAVHAFQAEARDVLFMPGRPRYRYHFHRDPSGRVTGFAQRREAWDISWTKRN